MPPVVMKVGSDFSVQSAKAAAQEAQRYWLKQEAHLKVDAQLSKDAAKKVAGEARAALLRQSADLTVEAKLSGQSARNVARDAERQFAQAGVSAGNQFRQGLTQGINQAVGNYTAQFGQLGTLATNAFTGIQNKAGMAALGVAGIGVAAAGVGTALYKMGAAWDDIGDAITARTGLIGADVKAITDAVKDVGSESGLALSQIGDIAGQVSQSLHLTGEPLKQMIDQLSALTQVTGQQVDVRSLAKTFRIFDIEDVQAQIDALNQLASVSQATGVPINELINSIQQSGRVTRQFGLDIGGTAGLLTAFEQAGLNSEKAATGLGLALKNLARDGREPKAALAEVIVEIKRLHDAGQETAAINLATSVFGKGYADFLNAIEGGQLDVRALNTALTEMGANDSIMKQKEATADWNEEWQSLTNTLTSVFEPAAAYVFGNLNAQLQGPKDLIDHIINSVKSPAFTGVPGTPGTPVTPDALLGQMGLAAPATPGAPTPSSVPPPTTRPTPKSFYNQWYPPSGGNAPAGAPSAAPSSSSSPGVPPAAPASASTSGYGDAALLANVPAGRYSKPGSGAWDLTQGLGDCSSAIEDLVAIMDGRPTGGRSMATGNEAEWLTAHGFLPGMGGPGDFRVGFNSSHTQATLPGGTPFNWGSDAAAARGGVGGTGADDPAFTSHFYRPGTGSSIPGMPSAAPGSPAGTVIPVFVTNFDQMMTAGGPAGPGAGGPGAGGPAGQGPGGAGPFDPKTMLGSFFSGLQQGGGIGGIVGGIGNNIMTNWLPPVQTFDVGGDLQPGITIAQNNTGRPEQVLPHNAPGVGSSMGPSPQGGIGQNQGPGSLAAKGASPVGGGEPANTPGGGQSGGGLVGAATSAAATAADMFAPGSGAAVQIASQEIQRAIKFGGQATAIGVGGLMDTFLPFGGSDLAQNNWITRVAGGFADVQPQIPNTAGKSASVDAMNEHAQPGQVAPAFPAPISSGQGSGPSPGPQVTNNITYNSNGAANDPSLSDVTNHLTRGYQSIPQVSR